MRPKTYDFNRFKNRITSETRLDDAEKIRALRARIYTCPVCGNPKAHYRLHGYRCSNPGHQEIENNMTETQVIEAIRGFKDMR